MTYLLLSDAEIEQAIQGQPTFVESQRNVARKAHAKIRQALDDFIIKYRNDDAESILKGLNALVDRMEAK